MVDRDNRYPLAWPSGWKRHQPGQRKRAPFGVRRQVQGYSWKSLQSVSVENAVDQLDAELRRLGARDFVLSSNLKLRNDGWPRSGQPEPADPGVAVYFRLGGQPRCLACDRWTRTADNIVAIARHVDAIRGQERWGVGTMDQAFKGYVALPPTTDEWWLVLGVEPTATIAEIDAAFRRLSLTAHPDKGGSHEQQARLSMARDAGRTAIKLAEADA